MSDEIYCDDPDPLTPDEMDDGQTSTGTTIIAREPDGTEVDVTTGVQALYDLALGSMDYGSGFWTSEDAAPVAEIARVCGFEGLADLECYVGEQRGLEQAQHQRYLALQDHREPRIDSRG
jgi:hypothetical protein